MTEETVVIFGWEDWLVYGFALLGSLLIGVYYGCTGKKQSTTDEVLLGGRNMSVFPVSLSVCATLISTVSIIGFPAEIYNQGTMLWYILIGTAIGYIATAHVYYPIYYDLKITSIFEVRKGLDINVL
ncbi:unnamed protein product [Owenia fusiformis]|uniref:Sodium-coupled monocarboxylate transporter 1 n=1 Tax=Owenia fusiformis TaxID=6347 RepID=A0A8S4PWK4_OWEFU|nr:unnamed protein product [Owenia fusiformis]